TDDASGVYPVGTTTVVWTVTDIHGNVSSCSQDITVTDDEVPSITCEDNMTQAADFGGCDALVTVIAPAVNDNCGIASLVNNYNGTNDASDVYTIGTTTIVWTVTDIHGNVSTCSQDITITDDELPTIDCADAQTQTADLGNCDAAVTVTSPDVNDNCGVASVINDYTGTDNASAVYPVGTTTITWTVTDNAGNIAFCTQDITITDDELPEFVCPGDVNQTADAGNCDASLTFAPVIATDNCGIQSVVNDYNNSNNATDVYPVGTTLIGWTITDIHGNVSTCEQEIIITDDEAPALACPTDVNQTADAGNCDAFIDIDVPATSDNCGVLSVVNDYTGTDDATGTYAVGTTAVEWTVTDVHGNVTTCTQTIVITDDELPVFTCPDNVSQPTDGANCDALVVIPAVTATDNCGVASIVNDFNGTDNATDTYTVGTTTVTWTITDIHGNVSTCEQTVEITDDEAPEITCPANITQTADAGLCSADIVIDPAITSDNCAVASVVNDYNGTDNASDTYLVGTTVITWTVTDLAGDQTTCEQTIVVTDDEAPAIDCPSAITQTADNGVCEALVTFATPGNTDNCAVASVVNDYNGTDNATDVYIVGTTTIEWTATDIHGNVTTCTQTITITDDEAPIITCPANITQTADNGTCDAIVTVDPLVATDNCDVASIVNNYNGTDDASDMYSVGTTVVTWTVTDIHGNVATCEQTILITDDEAPAIACPEDMVELVGNNCEFIIPDYTMLAVASDNCDTDLTLTQNPAIGTELFGSGTEQLIEITATDDAGNATTCSFLITLDDVIAPSITCPADLTVQVDTNCEFVIPSYEGDLIVVENCNDPLVVQTPAMGTVVGPGTYTITFDVTDEDGNASTCNFELTVEDDLAPVITCPGDIVEQLVEECTHTLLDYTVLVEATDNCSEVTLTQLPTPGTVVTANTPIIIIAEDIYGNASTCTFNIILEDTILPVITCPEDIAIVNDLDACGAIVTYDLPVSSDNCTVADLSLVEGLPSGSEFPVGETTVTYTVTDGFGNQVSCSFLVTVTDTQLPEIICPEDITTTNDLGICGAAVDYVLPITLDNCGVASLTLLEGLNPGDEFPVGTTYVEYEVADVNGNTLTCGFNVTVNDEEAPVVTACPENIEVENDEASCGANVTYTLPEATDNCAVTAVELIEGPNSEEYFEVGTTTVVWSFIDEAGNQSLCSFEVTVVDTEAPVITCPADIVIGNNIGICGAFVDYTAPEVTDNCEVNDPVLTDGIPTGELFPVGETVISYEATDIYGNVSTCSFTITVEDTEAPVILCPEDITQIDPVVEYDEPFYTDNCEATIELFEGLPSGSDFPHGYTDIVYVATDLAGNTDTCSFTILINTPPVGNDDEAELPEEDEEVVIDPLDNDFDIDGDDIFVSDADAVNGYAEIVDNLIVYSPIDDWCGTDTITYVVCDEFLACDTAIIVVEVECFIDLIIPEGISPNGDGINDTFEIIGLEDYPDNEIVIFNRWGHKIFEMEDYDNSWGGSSEAALTIGNDILPEGTYFFLLELGGGLKPVKGYIYLNK
ncbi:MAG: HYR domain-containing protein, partial [Flavobacteriales bacterium]|nr:HYR domain-containing protein [Flavobacteriales bacterium]